MQFSNDWKSNLLHLSQNMISDWRTEGLKTKKNIVTAQYLETFENSFTLDVSRQLTAVWKKCCCRSVAHLKHLGLDKKKPVKLVAAGGVQFLKWVLENSGVKTYLNMDTFCDSLSGKEVISVYDSFFRNVISIVLLFFIVLINQSRGLFILVRGNTNSGTESAIHSTLALKGWHQLRYQSLNLKTLYNVKKIICLTPPVNNI